ncbi:hypothetical protein I7I50_00486 [Histoplasma capsulatum G186AR]|uniref:Uncharacterized protein n=1 Tax=Ajellomyces capsulatus TaxID=5037 RepID=A0A8H7YIM5_AJECA|nr:hypothetical protein I7I52_07754 [Histoplasma capsulatum]QSS72591.1 hypothetical protein I7I50_00486 [Histoplasma capsulatum G186AR]
MMISCISIAPAARAARKSYNGSCFQSAWTNGSRLPCTKIFFAIAYAYHRRVESPELFNYKVARQRER